MVVCYGPQASRARQSSAPDRVGPAPAPARRGRLAPRDLAPALRRGRGASLPPQFRASSTSRMAWEKLSAVKGFWRKRTPSGSVPWRRSSSSL